MGACATITVGSDGNIVDEFRVLGCHGGWVVRSLTDRAAHLLVDVCILLEDIFVDAFSLRKVPKTHVSPVITQC